MDFVKNKLACTQCVKILQKPVTMVCGETICQHHVNEQAKEHDCVCGENHPIPKGGFKINKFAEQMLKTKLDTLDFGEEYQSAVDAMNKLDEIVKKCSLLKQDPHFELDNVIGDIKKEIDLKREILKKGIDTEADTLIQQVIEYHNECKNKSSKYDFKQLEEKVKASEVEVEKSKEELSVLQIDKKKWQEIKESLETHSNALNGHFTRVRNELFLNKLETYQKEMILDLVITNSSKYKSKRRFVVKVSNCKAHSKEKVKLINHYLDDSKLNINLKITVQFYKISDTAPSTIGLYLAVRNIESKSESSYKANVTFKMLNRKDSSKDILKNEDLILDNELKLFHFLTFADLIKNEEFYDPIDDSFHTEVIIHSISTSDRQNI